MREKQEIIVIKLDLKKEKLLYPTNYALRERGYKGSLLQPLKLDPTRKNEKAITRMLKTPLNEF
jgi:hypothetical protein